MTDLNVKTGDGSKLTDTLSPNGPGSCASDSCRERFVHELRSYFTKDSKENWSPSAYALHMLNEGSKHSAGHKDRLQSDDPAVQKAFESLRMQRNREIGADPDR